MQSKAATVDAYLAELPADRREDVAAIRKVFLKNLPKGYKEGMTYGMIGYFVPHEIYPDGYHCDPKQPVPFAGIAAQKNYLSLYLTSIYMNPKMSEWFVEAYEATGKKLDKGKSCVRAKRLEDLALDVIGQAIAKIPVKEFSAWYEASKPKKKK
jgi:hypothetical protein